MGIRGAVSACSTGLTGKSGADGAQLGSARRGDWQWHCGYSMAIHRTRTAGASPPPLAELSSRNAAFPISSSQPLAAPHLAGLHRSPPHPPHPHLPALNSPNPYSLSLYSCSVSSVIQPLSFGPASACKMPFFGFKDQSCPCCSTHRSCTKVSVLFSVLFSVTFPFSLLLGIVSRCYQGAPCGCTILSVW